MFTDGDYRHLKKLLKTKQESVSQLDPCSTRHCILKGGIQHERQEEETEIKQYPQPECLSMRRCSSKKHSTRDEKEKCKQESISNLGVSLRGAVFPNKLLTRHKKERESSTNMKVSLNLSASPRAAVFSKKGFNKAQEGERVTQTREHL